jgi:hypothetical protein
MLSNHFQRQRNKVADRRIDYCRIQHFRRHFVARSGTLIGMSELTELLAAEGWQ